MIKWISIKDKLPDLEPGEVNKYSIPVMVSIKLTNDYDLSFAYYSYLYKKWHSARDLTDIENVTHWMLLPNQPNYD